MPRWLLMLIIDLKKKTGVGDEIELSGFLSWKLPRDGSCDWPASNESRSQVITSIKIPLRWIPRETCIDFFCNSSLVGWYQSAFPSHSRASPQAETWDVYDAWKWSSLQKRVFCWLVLICLSFIAVGSKYAEVGSSVVQGMECWALSGVWAIYGLGNIEEETVQEGNDQRRRQCATKGRLLDMTWLFYSWILWSGGSLHKTWPINISSWGGKEGRRLRSSLMDYWQLRVAGEGMSFSSIVHPCSSKPP